MLNNGAYTETHFSACNSYAGSIVLMLTYGYKSANENDPLVQIVNDAMHGFSETTESGTFAVDVFPIRKSYYY